MHEHVDLARPDAVLFDLDGTLVDTVAVRIRAWDTVFAEFGIPATQRRIARLIGIDGRRLVREIAAVAGLAIDAAQQEVIDRRCGEIYADLNRDPRPLPGVRSLVDALEVRGIPWAIATSSRREQVAASVAALGL
jgi:beta-phosphoglucomutase-like phosphatase (HAD superfamily)